jgi:hypothetical protein
MSAIEPFKMTQLYLDSLAAHEEIRRDFEKYGIKDAAQRLANGEEGLERSRRRAEREIAGRISGTAQRTSTTSGQLPSSVTNALANASPQGARLGTMLQGMVSQVAQINHYQEASRPERIAETRRDYGDRSADLAVERYADELRKLMARAPEDLDELLREEGFTVKGDLFAKRADGSYGLGQATVKGKGVTLTVTPDGLTVTPAKGKAVSGKAISAPVYPPTPGSLAAGKGASDLVAFTDATVDKALEDMARHNKLAESLKPDSLAALRERHGEAYAEQYRAKASQDLAALKFDPAAVGRDLAAKGLTLHGSVAERQADGTYKAGHFLVSAALPGASLAYDSLAGAFLGTENAVYQLASRTRAGDLGGPAGLAGRA